jgi:N-acetylmuramoyl-L-alanine amidase
VEEEKQMLSQEWQKKMAAAITAAINDFFATGSSIFR